MSKRLEQIQRPKTSIELAYLAGYFDGEGCVRLDATKIHSLHIAIVSSDRTVLERFVSAFGGNLTPVKKKQPNYRELWHWGACNTAAQSILLQLIPFLQAKLTQATLAILPQYKRENVGRGHEVPESELNIRGMVHEALRVAKLTMNGQALI